MSDNDIASRCDDRDLRLFDDPANLRASVDELEASQKSRVFLCRSSRRRQDPHTA